MLTSMQWLSKGEVGRGKGKKPSPCALQGEACSGQAGWELLRPRGWAGSELLGRHLQDWALCSGAEWIIEYQRMAMGGKSWPSREKPGPDRTRAYQGARHFSGLNDLV